MEKYDGCILISTRQQRYSVKYIPLTKNYLLSLYGSRTTVNVGELYIDCNVKGGYFKIEYPEIPTPLYEVWN